MMPDGGRACADIRWYCKDAKSCTERWTAQLSRGARRDPGQRDLVQHAPAALVEGAGSEESQRAGGA
jgi:hypothetical protein